MQSTRPSCRSTSQGAQAYIKQALLPGAWAYGKPFGKACLLALPQAWICPLHSLGQAAHPHIGASIAHADRRHWRLADAAGLDMSVLMLAGRLESPRLTLELSERGPLRACLCTRRYTAM